MKKKAGLITSIILAIVLVMCVILNYTKTGQVDTEKVEKVVDKIIEGIELYEMSEEQIKDLPTTVIEEKTEEDEKAIEQATTEVEGFEEQGNIAYNGTSEYPSVSLGNYQGLTYYSQIDNRWKDHPYTSIGDYSQTIGSSGCGPTSASMVVTAIKGAITPPEMGDLFVKYGYRSANNGTYFSAFRWVADTFDIPYEETYTTDSAVSYLRNNNYVVVSCANGLFTTGGHFIVIVGIDGDTLKIYDPYLYAGKFDTSTRRGKVTVDGNTVYCSIDNFRNYANAQKFFAYKYDGTVPTNNDKPVVTESYTRYVNASIGLNVRSAPNGKIIRGLSNGTAVTVSGTDGNWSYITSPMDGWVCSTYLTSAGITNNTTTSGKRYTTGKYKVICSLLNVRTGASTRYKAKRYYELSSNARSQNSRLGNYYANGYKYGVTCSVSRISGNWGLTPSGWICLDYCKKI